jgi:hypothetical protein
MDARFRAVLPPRVEKGFDESRSKLVDILNQLTFMRISVISFPKESMRQGNHFQGECVEILNNSGRTSSNPRVGFFSRYSRQNGSGFNLLGGFTLIDCPVGAHHSSAMPQVGDILVGSLIPASKGKLPYELRGWCNNAKPLMELARIVQFGTRIGELELKRLLRQPASDSANALLRIGSQSLTEAEKQYAKSAASSADDFWFLARVVCFGKLDEDPTLKLSKSWIDLIDSIAMRFGDEALLDAWANKRPAPQIQSQPQPQLQLQTQPQTQPNNLINLGYGLGYTQATTTEYDPSKVFASAYVRAGTPPLSMSAKIEEIEYVPKSPTYEPHSPYAPASPAYAPTSPIDDKDL